MTKSFDIAIALFRRAVAFFLDTVAGIMRCTITVSKNFKTFNPSPSCMEINQNQKDTEARVKYQGIGWKSLLQVRAGTSRILVLKSVVRGIGLLRGTPIYSYLAQDQNGRPVMVSYLDGKHRIIKGDDNAK